MAFRVLIVDDSPVMRGFIRRTMQLSGLEVAEFLEAGDGAEALAVLGREWVDVILTDLNMPVMDGEQFLRRLDADDLLKSVPVVIVSTDGTQTRAQQMLALGASGYVKKPFTPETLRGELERVLGASYA